MVDIKLIVDTKDALEELGWFKHEFDALYNRFGLTTESLVKDAFQVEKQIKDLEINTGKVKRDVTQAIDESWNVLQQYLSIAGITIEGVTGSVIRSVFAGIASLRALATAQLSNTFTAFMAVATFTATSIASAQAIAAEVTAEEEKRRLEKLQPYIDQGIVIRT